MYCDDENKEQIECLIDILTELAKSSDESLFDKIFSKVVKALKAADAPEEIESVNNAWDFLGVINYHGGDHFLYQATMDELESTVVSAGRDRERLLNKYRWLTQSSGCDLMLTF